MQLDDLILIASAIISLAVIYGACIYSDRQAAKSWEEYQDDQWGERPSITKRGQCPSCARDSVAMIGDPGVVSRIMCRDCGFILS